MRGRNSVHVYIVHYVINAILFQAKNRKLQNMNTLGIFSGISHRCLNLIIFATLSDA